MKNITRHYGKLIILERMKNSTNGNPRFRLFITANNQTGVNCITQVDCAYNYDIKNLEGKNVIVTIGTHYGKPTLNSILEDK